jgi:hypothetical protein
MPITGQGWEILIKRLAEQTHPVSRLIRTVGTYQVYHAGQLANAILVDGTLVALSGTSDEAPGPGDNSIAGKEKKRIAPRRYPLGTWGFSGSDYATYHYGRSNRMVPPMPGIHVRDTEARTKILIHPGKRAFLSSVGCINLCTALPDARERIDYPGSRRRVIALIENMKQFLGDAFPAQNGRRIPNAFAVIDGDP